MAKLQIQTLAAGIRRNEDTRILCKGVLDLLALVHVHRAVEADNPKTAFSKELLQHLLGRDELGEHQGFQFRVTFVSLYAIEPVKQRFGFGIGPGLYTASSGLKEQLHLSSLVLERLQTRGEQCLDLLLPVEIRPLVVGVHREEGQLFLRRFERFQPALECGTDGARAGNHETLHQDHEEPDVAALLAHGLVVALTHIFSDRLVEELLIPMRLSPGDGRKFGLSWFEQRRALSGNGAAFFSPDHIGLDPISRNAANIGKRFSIDQGDQPMESIGLSLVRRRRQQEEIRCGFAESLAQFEPGHLVGAAAESVGFIDDDQIPTGGDQVLEPILVVLSHLLRRPPAPAFHWLDRIHRADYLRIAPPDVVFLGNATVSREVAGNQQPEIFVEMGAHLGHPLGYQAFRSDDQYPTNQSA